MANGRDKYQTDRKCKQKVKYVLIIGDGMADFPIESLNGKTPLEAANKPVMDALAMRGIVGKVRTVPIGVPAGSDTAILSIFGFDPRKVYTGRSPLEAAGSGVKMEKGNVSFRCNLAAVSVDGGPYEQQTMISHSGGNIDGKDAQTLMYDLLADPDFSALLEKAGMRFTVNPSYRHIAILKEGSADVTLTPPHDILTRCVKDYLPRGAGDEMLLCLMKASYEYLNRHPLNVQRVKDGLPAANSLWFWGEGSAVVLDSFQKLFGHTGDVITAVPLVKGIAELAGLRHTDVPGANGDLDTNYAGKGGSGLKSPANRRLCRHPHRSAGRDGPRRRSGKEAQGHLPDRFRGARAFAGGAGQAQRALSHPDPFRSLHPAFHPHARRHAGALSVVRQQGQHRAQPALRRKKRRIRRPDGGGHRPDAPSVRPGKEINRCYPQEGSRTDGKDL